MQVGQKVEIIKTHDNILSKSRVHCFEIGDIGEVHIIVNENRIKIKIGQVVQVMPPDFVNII